MSKLCVVGAGRVGLVIAACFAYCEHQVVCVDTDEEKVKQLWRKEMPFYELGLEKMVCETVAKGNLSFTTSYTLALNEAEFVFITVGTPTDSTGKADVSAVVDAMTSIAKVTKGPITIVIKSTVPVGTNEEIIALSHVYTPELQFDLVANPEFLQEGNAVRNCLNPDRIVIGASNVNAAWRLAELYSSSFRGQPPIVTTDFKSAEMIKYASNAYLATRISFINEIANICDLLGADVAEVTKGMGYDKRIGHDYLSPGLGYGGSCFPKDVAALKRMALDKEYYYSFMLEAVDIMNSVQLAKVRLILAKELGDLGDKQIGVLGLSFKPNTDDIRESPALNLITSLIKTGVKIKVYDPVAMDNAKKEFPDIEYCKTAYDVADNADALIVATEWEEFKMLNMQSVWGLMRTPLVIDGRNIYNPEQMKDWAFVYYGIGRR